MPHGRVFWHFFINNSRKGSAGAVTALSAGLLPEPAKRRASRLSPTVSPAAAPSLQRLWAPGLQPSTLSAARPAPTARRVLGLPDVGNTREEAAEATAASRQRRGGRRKRDLAAARAGRARKSPCHISSQDRARVWHIAGQFRPTQTRDSAGPAGSPRSAAVPATSPIPAARGRPRAKPTGPAEASLCQRDRTPLSPAPPASPHTSTRPSPAPRTATNGAQGEKGPPRPTSRPAEDGTSPGGARGRAGGRRKEGSVQKGEAGRGWGAPAETTLRARCRRGSFPPRTPAAGSCWGRAQPTAPGQPRVLLSCVVSLCPAWCPRVLRLPGVPASPPRSARAQPSPAAEAGGQVAGRRAPHLDVRPWPFLTCSTEPAEPGLLLLPRHSSTAGKGDERPQAESRQHGLPPAGAGHSPRAGKRDKLSLRLR
ncbi:translation initiation factor IF-2-like [Cygnus olor]|uniref:translation initiation factor IF-2-like n=1 Tax=Cygnus olor TaxID=8869 RepID=UPI001ADDECC1|nr:translation initiation factor IF-2-like [Cygnus olor]